MDTNDTTALLTFRTEYEQSGMTKAEFARSKNMEYWKANYALRKALRLKTTDSPPVPKVRFRKLSTQSISNFSNELRIKTSYGAEIIIPL